MLNPCPTSCAVSLSNFTSPNPFYNSSTQLSASSISSPFNNSNGITPTIATSTASYGFFPAAAFASVQFNYQAAAVAAAAAASSAAAAASVSMSGASTSAMGGCKM